MRVKRNIYILVACIVMIVSRSSVFAQDRTLNFTVSPVSVRLETDPHVPVDTIVKVRNNGTEIEHIALHMMTFVPDTSGERPILKEFPKDDPVAGWMIPEESDFSVEPGEWKNIPVKFSPPEASALDYYYALVFERSLPTAPKSGETVVSGAPAILILSHVRSPNAKRELQLEKFSTNAVFFEFLPIRFTVKIKNTGNTFLAPAGNIFIDGQGKKDLTVLSFNPNTGTILPQSDRSFTVEWQDGFPSYVTKTQNDQDLKDAKGNILRTLHWDLSKADTFRFGRYTAHLLMVYDNGERDVPIESSVAFWVIPWRMVFGGLILLFFTTIGISSTIRPILHKLRGKQHT